MWLQYQGDTGQRNVTARPRTPVVEHLSKKVELLVFSASSAKSLRLRISASKEIVLFGSGYAG